MKNEATLRTRREFLRTTVLGGALASTVPAFLANTFSALQAHAADSAIQTTTGRDGDILVVLQMAGGNDGLNTVVPFSNDYYRRSRPRIGIAAADVLKLNDDLGFHPSLTGFKDLYDSGNLAVIQGIGYPNPNRSHFRSTEIWQTASDSESFEKYGWLGRYFDNACSGCDPTVGVSIGRQMPQAFAARHPLGISLENPQQYRFLSSDHGQSDGQEESFRKLNEADASMAMDAGIGAESNSGGTIGSLHGKTAHHGSALDFLERTSMDAEMSSDKIIAVSNKVQNKAQYPQSQLANSLKLVARLIGGGLPTRVYYVSQGMERFNGIFVCTTNLMDRIDQAALRRFTFKIRFRPLTGAQREKMFVVEALGGDGQGLTPQARARLGKLDQLCPGDFAAVKRQVQILAAQFTADEFLEQLEAEHRIKPEVRDARSIGFVH